MQKVIKVKDICISNENPMVLIAGPCQIESLEHSLMIATKISEICKKIGMPFIFKSSFDKANRSSSSSKRGVGIEAAKEIFSQIKKSVNCPILTDVHNENHCNEIADFVDVLQIPAFLCRQTDLLKAAAQTGKVVNVKKGQFLAPWDVKNIIGKMESFENDKIMLTERGTSFGYNTLISDMRGLDIMRDFGYPVIFDATHSVQQPGGQGSVSGGERKFVTLLSRAALSATKIAGIFAEVHENPSCAPSDGPCMLEIDKLELILRQLKSFDDLSKSL
ncbi:3-deoxy-8-phosphooctulonate synthase [Candidatus Deianiraea vastatrix]|uniref:2-dehydro-3-deoxyphosphooctonate aldolase n=1 Tax=Candidatus Deianiraea vastatrix TaxID=2163644 RepID=A0A5B8XCR0_9RICK|nr:3-deoxy-8-phosphooctulonate synthase [Candidatus Deianiraea vastatrix]QED23159.1 2-dehydro-3-deoxyphosphooctonate aldolase [Candidatus Deianiraea vastatrix]